MKPDTTQAMRILLEQIREAMPFDHPEAAVCAGPCNGCSRKLLEFMAAELDSWEYRLNQGEVPNFGDLDKLAKSARKVHTILKKNGLVEER